MFSVEVKVTLRLASCSLKLNFYLSSMYFTLKLNPFERNENGGKYLLHEDEMKDDTYMADHPSKGDY